MTIGRNSLASSILGGGRGSSSESSRGERATSRNSYDENSGLDRANVDAIDHDGLSLLSITMVETGTYDAEYLRPYVVSATKSDINKFAEVVEEEGGLVGASSVAGIAGRIMHYSTRVSDRDLIDIENGWDEKRFSFIIEVVEREMDEYDLFNPDKEVVTFVSGYTDCMDVAKATSLTRRGSSKDQEVYLAPETRFYVTNMHRVERATRRIRTNNQLIVPAYHRATRYRDGRSDELFTLRPKDVFVTQTVNSIAGFNDDPQVARINNANKLTGSQAKPSRSSNLTPATYMASTVNALHRAETKVQHRDAYGGFNGEKPARTHVYSDAKSLLREDTAYEPNGFLQLLRRKSNGFNQDQTFTWSELGYIFGRDDIEDITDIHTSSPVKQDDRQARHGEGAGWDNNENSGRNAVFATVLKQALPSYALEAMIYACRIEASNILSRTDEMSATAGALVTVSDVIFAARLEQRDQEIAIRQFEESIASNILRDLSLDNHIDYDIVVDLDWRFDSFIDVSIENGPWLEFPVAGFSRSLSSPIITTCQETTTLIGEELKSIVNNILRG